MKNLKMIKLSVSNKLISVYKDSNKDLWFDEALVVSIFELDSFEDYLNRLKYAGCFIVREICVKKFEVEGKTSRFINLKTLDFSYKVFNCSEKGEAIHDASNKWLVENNDNFLLSELPENFFCSLNLNAYERAFALSNNLERKHLYDQPANVKIPEIDEFYVFRVIDKLQSTLNLNIPRFKKKNNSTDRKELLKYCKLINSSSTDFQFLGHEPSLEEIFANIFYTLVTANLFDYCDYAIDIAVVLFIMDEFYSRPPFSCSVSELITNEQITVALQIAKSSPTKSADLIHRLSRCFTPSGLSYSVLPMSQKELQQRVRSDRSKGNVIRSIIAFLESYHDICHFSDYYTISYAKCHMGASCLNFHLNVVASLEKGDKLVFDYTLIPFIENELEGCLDIMLDEIVRLATGEFDKDIPSNVTNAVTPYFNMNGLELELHHHIHKPRC